MKIESTGEQNMVSPYRVIQLLAAGLTAVLLSACDTDKPTTLQDSIVTVGPVSVYDLSASVIPFPNDLLFQGTADGTINIPVADESDLSDPQVAINGVDGFSTVAPMSTGFSRALDPNSINGTSVRVYEVVKANGAGSLGPDPSGPVGPIVAYVRKLQYGTEYIATLSSVDATNSTLVIAPLEPLKPSTSTSMSSYAVLITDDLKGTDGKPVAISTSYLLTRGSEPIADLAATAPYTADDIFVNVLKPEADATQDEIDQAYSDAATLELLRSRVVNPSEAILVANDADTIVSSDVILHWTFTVQSVDDVLNATRTQVRGITAVSGFADPPTGPVDSPLGAASIKVGVLQVPYYLTASDTSVSPSNDPTALTSFWQGPGPSYLSYLAANLTPVETSTQTLPVVVSIPKTAGGACGGTVPVEGWPVVIFQHGITRNRADMLAVADSLALACMAVVAIDMPMHGITGNETGLTAAFKNPAVNGGERTFDLDLVTQDTDGNITAQLPDGVIDTSGIHYINLTNLQNTRDNVRQGVSDLFMLVHAIESGVVSDGINTMNASRIYFLGHSLGAIVGTTFTAVERNVRDAAFAFGGSSLPKILDGSATFGPPITAGLAANGIDKGTPDYESFIGAAQTVVDSGDPVNHAFDAANGRGILFFEIVGDGTADNPSDLVVPNTVPDSNDTSGTVAAPLAGTEPQLKLMGLTQQNSSTSGTNLRVVTKYIAGAHASLLDPGPNAAVTTEIQTQAANFLASDGDNLVVTDPSVLQVPPAP
ncbi:MAG: hypothetical protein WBP02_06075 [Gammaproteobacteria bacterium]|jgi:pimeloyl-ACP methyl ester carboxylesterase